MANLREVVGERLRLFDVASLMTATPEKPAAPPAAPARQPTLAQLRAMTEAGDALVASMVANILGDENEEQVITKATYIAAERFTPPAAAAKGTPPEQRSG